GFQLTSPDGDFVIKLRGIVQADSRFFFQDQVTAIDTFTLRRVRPIIEGTVFKIFDFRITPDFGGGTTVLQDAYLDARFNPAFKLRFGKAKSPFGLERLQSASDIEFIERSLANNLVPNRDLGIQAVGDLAGGKLNYAIAVMNGVVDGGSADTDLGNGKDAVGRIFAQPVTGLGIGIAFSAGTEKGFLLAPSLPTYRTSGQQPFFRYRVSTTIDATVVADGNRYRYSPQFYYYNGPVGILGEYVFTSQKVRKGPNTATIGNNGVNLNVYYVLTGEKASYKYVVPDHPFDLDAGGWGAFEAVFRYSRLDIDNDAFPVFADPGLFSTLANNWTVGLNWYLNKNVKFVFDYDQTNFDGGALKTEKLFVTRFQIAF
ncbi:MAG TPA: porin, partial [Acidobacteriota bacterium]|nr:porin [Acidobacteriota bacterium]